MQLVVPAVPTATAAAGPLIEAVQAGRLAGCLDAIPGLNRQRCGEMRFVPASRASAPAALPSRNLPSGRPSRWAMIARAGSAPVVQMVERLRGRGLRVGGFLQVPCGPHDRILGYDLVRLGKSDRIPIADRVAAIPGDGKAFCKLSFRTESLAVAFQWLRDDARAADVLLIDGVGKLEGKGQGHFPALRWAREIERPLVVLVSLRADLIPSLRKKLGLPGLILEGVTPQHADPWLDQIHDCCKGRPRPRKRRLPEGSSP
jgi:nucleoside-triphosphatase THEP1